MYAKLPQNTGWFDLYLTRMEWTVSEIKTRTGIVRVSVGYIHQHGVVTSGQSPHTLLVTREHQTGYQPSEGSRTSPLDLHKQLQFDVSNILLHHLKLSLRE